MEKQENGQKKEKSAKKENVHKEHRQRLKRKFLEFGAEALEEHEFVELMLYYAIPQKDVNELAHKLLREFGSLANILDATSEVLKEIDGVGDHTISMFSFMRACARKYISDTNDITKARLTPFNIHLYIKNLFYGHNNEIAYALLLDSECVVRKIKKISLGTESHAYLEPRDIVKFAVNEKFPYLMLAHNHPGGNPVPSREDLATTKTIEKALNYINVRLIDHVIVAGDHVTSIAKSYNILEK